MHFRDIKSMPGLRQSAKVRALGESYIAKTALVCSSNPPCIYWNSYCTGRITSMLPRHVGSGVTQFDIPLLLSGSTATIFVDNDGVGFTHQRELQSSRGEHCCGPLVAIGCTLHRLVCRPWYFDWYSFSVVTSSRVPSQVRGSMLCAVNARSALTGLHQDNPIILALQE